MPRPDDEASIFLAQLEPDAPGSGPNPMIEALIELVPEVEQADGTVDPVEAVVTLVDRVKALTARIEQLERRT